MHIPCTSAVRATGSTLITPPSPETSSPALATASRGRNRLDVRFARRTGASSGTAAYDSWRRRTASLCWAIPDKIAGTPY